MARRSTPPDDLALRSPRPTSARRGTRRLLHVVPAILLVFAACTGGGTARPAPSPTPEVFARGGTLRVGMTDPLELDPQVGYDQTQYQDGWELLRCCLLRTLISYNGRSAAEGGARVLPDLAAATPEVSEDALTWTFRIKPGIRYAPPLQDVEVTSADFVRALERSARTEPPGRLRDSPGRFFLSVIHGYHAFASGAADTIAGLGTPDEHTLVVRLNQPAGDLPNRLALPMAAPLPPNPYDPEARLGVADGNDYSYDRFLVSTGPYMIEGSEDVDLAQPPDLRVPAAGYVPGQSLTLVRNPSWDRATDDLREAFVDRIEIVIGLYPRSADDLARMVERKGLDLLFDLRHAEPPGGLARWRDDPTLSDRVAVTSTLANWFVGINLAQPPLDDVHVRRAIGLALDRAALARMTSRYRGYATPQILRHFAPDSTEDLLLTRFDPFGVAGDRGDLDAAEHELSLSAYDLDGDGRCDRAVCRRVPAFTRPDLGGAQLADRIASELRPLGLKLALKETGKDSAWRRCAKPRQHAGLCIDIGWIADYPNGSQFFPGMFSSDVLGRLCDACGNMFLLGATGEQLAAWGYQGDGITGVDDRIDRCLKETGHEQFVCWAELDQYLMTKVVPLIPFAQENTARIFSDRVRGFTVDEFMTMPSLDHVAVAGGSTEAPPPVTSFGPTMPLPPGEPGVPDGTYETKISLADAQRVGFRGSRGCLDSAGCVAGTYRLTVHGGRWSWAQESELPLPPFCGGAPGARGRVVRLGQQVTIVIAKPKLCRRSAITVRGSLAGDTLALRILSTMGMDPYFRVVFESHPWEKVA